MQTKQLFDCRPVSVVRRSFLFFCTPLSSSHRGRGAFGYTCGALANCVITSLPSKAYNTLRERHKSNSSPLLIQFCFFLSFFSFTFLWVPARIATREKSGHLAHTRTDGVHFGGYITGPSMPQSNPGQQRHETIVHRFNVSASICSLLQSSSHGFFFVGCSSLM